MSEDTQLIELAKAAKKINDELGITAEQAYEKLLEGIHKETEMYQTLFDVISIPLEDENAQNQTRSN